MMMEHQPPPLLHPIVAAVNNNNNNHFQNQGEVARVVEEENEVGDSDNEQDEHADDVPNPSPTFVHTTFISCPEEKVDIIGRIQIKDFLSKTIEESGCVSDQFYRRVLQKNPIIATDGNLSSSASGQAKIDDFPQYYTYPNFPSKKELSLESKPHQILDLGRWVTRDDFESHLLMDYLSESFSKSLIEEFVEVLPIMTTWNIHTMEVCDVVESLNHTSDESIQATINVKDEEDENKEYSDHSASSQGKGRDEEGAARNTASSTYANASTDVSSNPEDNCCASFNRKRTDTSSTVRLSASSCSSQKLAEINNIDNSSNSDNISESSSSSPSTTSPPSYHSSSLLPGSTTQLAFEVNDDKHCSDLTAVAAASRQILKPSNEFCSGSCCTWKRHCSMYWIKYSMEFVVTQKRTLKSNVPTRRRQQLLRMMKEVAVQRYGLKSNAETSNTTIEGNETIPTLSSSTRTSSTTDSVSGCMRYEILESDYRETSNEIMEIVTWRSSYDYEKRKDEIKDISSIQKLIRSIDSYFQNGQEEICYWETLVCE